jgi:GAF domain-containing protein
MHPERFWLPRHLNLLESLCNQVALALEVELLTVKCLPKSEQSDRAS